MRAVAEGTLLSGPAPALWPIKEATVALSLSGGQIVQFAKYNNYHIQW
jgi:hypothetical protein